jgi:hypothetical protein
MPPSISSEPQAGVQADATDFADRQLFRKITWRLMPLLLTVFVIAYVDRINVGLAKLQIGQRPWL